MSEVSTFILSPQATLHRLRRCVRAPDVPHQVSLEEAVRLVTQMDHGRFVFDPADLRETEFLRVATAIRDSHLDVLVYTTLPWLVRASRIEAAFPIELLIAGSESETELLPSLLRPGTDFLAPALVRHHLTPVTRELPDTLRVALDALFGWAAIPQGVDDFAVAVRKDSGTVNRWLRAHNVAPISDILVAAHLSRAFPRPGGAPGGTRLAAGDTGGPASRNVQLWFKRFTGLSPTRAVATLSTAEFARRIAGRLLSG